MREGEAGRRGGAGEGGGWSEGGIKCPQAHRYRYRYWPSALTWVMLPRREWQVCRGTGLMTPTRHDTPGKKVVLR